MEIRPISRSYVDLEVFFVHSDPPPNVISDIANQKIIIRENENSDLLYRIWYWYWEGGQNAPKDPLNQRNSES